MAQKCSNIIKILVVGASQVGKSSLTTTLHNKTFQDSSYIPTIAVDFISHIIQLDGRNVKLQLWDMSAYGRFSSIKGMCYHGVHGIIIVYDVTYQYSFGNIL